MLPLSSKIGFLIFAIVTLAIGLRGFYRVYLRVRRGRADVDLRLDHVAGRLWYAVKTSLTQSRTFRERSVVSFFHSFIFYGFVFYLLVNLVDAVEGYIQPGVVAINFTPFVFDVLFYGLFAYGFLADVLSFLVLVGVVALLVRRFLLPARRNFAFNSSSLLHDKVRFGYVNRDSLIVSVFILFHVGSRAIGAGAKIAASPRPDLYVPGGWNPALPFSSLLAYLFTPQNAHAWQIFGYWGALGSVLLFLAYFPYTKHIHIFAAPLKYFFARDVKSGVLPLVDVNLESLDENAEQKIGANKLEDLAWPRLLDAYACIQCNRCQDVCPATATGKSLSPAALEINKRMELNQLSGGFENGAASPRTLLQFALTPEAAWACTTCGACMEVCPVQDEQMLDIIDIRRHQVMMEGEFPSQLQTAFRGMERNKNPWGINHEQRLAWADGLKVKTTEENPEPDVLYWVGCAASYDPQAQKTARAFVQLLDHAGVDFAVLGKKECCTGDSARRAGNEVLYLQLADQNVSTLNEVRPKLVVASCPHCMNALGSEYRQIGGDYKVMHHTEYLDSLVSAGKIKPQRQTASITYHDPCYLGRHNDVYDAPRNLLKVLGSEFVELDRTRNNSFCCGAGGAQFWKEEEPGDERISENRFKEVQRTLAGKEEKTLAVGCPFCKSMLGSTPSKDGSDAIAIRDVAELLWESVKKQQGAFGVPRTDTPVIASAAAPVDTLDSVVKEASKSSPSTLETQHSVAAEVKLAEPSPVERKKWQRKALSVVSEPAEVPNLSALSPELSKQDPPLMQSIQATSAPAPKRKKWSPKASAAKSEGTAQKEEVVVQVDSVSATGAASIPSPDAPVERKKWQPKAKS